MAFSYYAEDNEFAVSTGANVNDGAGTSTFDYPPNSTKNLVITSQAGDDDRRLFSLGDTYSVSFAGNGGTSIANATVIRTDPMSGNEGAVVFEGLDPSGNLIQVVWSPNFDLETWFSDNSSGGNSPGFYTTDQDAGTYRYACFVSGTLIDTPDGPRPVQRLGPGDLVETRDHGPQPILWCTSSQVPGLGRGAPITIAPEVLGGSAPLIVSPQHRVLISNVWTGLLFDEAEVLVPAKFLVDGIKVRRVNTAMVTYHHLLFARHEMLTAQGMVSESLYLGDDLNGVLSPQAQAELATVTARNPMQPMSPARQFLLRYEAQFLRKSLGLQQADTTTAPPSFLFVQPAA